MDVISRTSRRFVHTFFLVTTVSICSTACASSPSGGTTTGPKPGPNLITADEISRISVQNAFEAVQKLRPTMLRHQQVASANGQGGVAEKAPPIRGTGVASGGVVVYMDGTRLGPVDQLRQISAATIGTVRYFSASEAQMKWGSGHPGGVIEVTTKR